MLGMGKVMPGRALSLARVDPFAGVPPRPPAYQSQAWADSQE